jgi:hypothetical protein
MTRIPVLAALLVLTTALGPVEATVQAQCGNAYTDEMAGPGGTYGSPGCETAELTGQPVPVGGIAGAVDERNATAMDNPDAPPAFRDTATFEGEREP